MLYHATEDARIARFPHSDHDLAQHFTGKVSMIRASIVSARPPTVVVRESPPFSSFAPVTLEEIHRLVLAAPCKTCELDPVPTWLVKRSVDLLAPGIVDICSASLQTGYFPASQIQARVSARLKKPSMDPDDLNSFRPISNLSFLSKIVERVAVRQFLSLIHI